VLVISYRARTTTTRKAALTIPRQGQKKRSYAIQLEQQGSNKPIAIDLSQDLIPIPALVLGQYLGLT
jgi:hypothetical protein